MKINRITMIFYLLLCSASSLSSQVHGNSERGSIDKMRDTELQPEKIMDAVKLTSGMIVGEAGAGYGYFNHFLSRNQIRDMAVESGYSVIKADDSFLKSHMIIVLQ